MLIGVLSDTHDRLPQIAKALDVFERQQVAAVIHAGDIVSPFAAKAIKAVEARCPLHVIYGNNEGESAGVASILPQICRGPLRLELDGCRILVHHYDKWCDPADIGWADVVVSGHTHDVVNTVRGGKLFLNSGECCGWVKGRSTIALLDTAQPSARIVELEG